MSSRRRRAGGDLREEPFVVGFRHDLKNAASIVFHCTAHMSELLEQPDMLISNIGEMRDCIADIDAARDRILRLVEGFGQGVTLTTKSAPPDLRRAAPAGPAVRPSRSGAIAATARRRVLVIDDEAAVATALRRCLKRDYDVVVMSDPRRALAVLLDGEQFDAVLCDVVMPDLTGREIYERLAKEAPAIAERTLFLTAGATTKRDRAFLARMRDRVLDKPIDVARVRDVLRARARSPG